MDIHELVLQLPLAHLHLISVYQLTLLEVDHNGTDTPTGVVLALVGSCREDESSSKDVEATKSLRMYSLSSIISLAKWAASSKVTSDAHSIIETTEMTPYTSPI